MRRANTGGDPCTNNIAVAISSAQKAFLLRTAQSRGISVSRLVRQAVGQFIAQMPAG